MVLQHHLMEDCPVLNRFSHVQLFVTPWTVGAPLSMALPRQEYCSE